MARTSHAPYLSVVVTARNDNHGGNMLARMRAMLDSWVSQAEQFGIESEILVVEWNPPEDRPRLREIFGQSFRSEICEVRFVEVPHHLHALFGNSTAIPLHQMIAKNVGIRRARGEYVLATNIDIVCSSDLMKFFGQRSLTPRTLYRMDRHDISSNLPESATTTELLHFCETHLLRVFAREGDFRLSSDGTRMLDDEDIVTSASGVRFGKGWFSVESSLGERYRWLESEAELIVDQTGSGVQNLVISAEIGPSAGSDQVRLDITDESDWLIATGEVRGRCLLNVDLARANSPRHLFLRTYGKGLPLSSHPRIVNLRIFAIKAGAAGQTARLAEETRPGKIEMIQTGPAFDWNSSFSSASPHAHEMKTSAYLHTNAAGDFTLLSRDDWFALRGYAELPIWPMHIDLLLCYAAHHSGIRESILHEPMRAYHVEHSSGAGWTPEGEALRAKRIKAKAIRELRYEYAAHLVDLMRKYNAPVTFNRSNWGLADYDSLEAASSANLSGPSPGEHGLNPSPAVQELDVSQFDQRE